MKRRWIGVAVATASLALLGCLLRGEAPPTLTRGPYVMNPTPTSITIAWNTGWPADSRVDYGTGPGYGGSASDPRATTAHALTVTGLEAGALYHYRIVSGGQTLAEGHTFRASRDERDPHFTFVVLGDSGTGGRAQYAVADRIQALRPDFVLHTGDVVYPSGEAKHFDAKYFLPYRDLIAGIPFFLSLGNHDVRTAGGRAYLDAFHLPANNPEGTKRYYSFDYGNARFIALDSNQDPGPGAAITAWVQAELARPPKPWTFVFFHHPPYSSGRHGGNRAIRKAWSPLFERARVAVVFSGHDHSYERTIPVREFVPDAPGVVYVVTGGGGDDLYKVGRSAWTASSASINHVVRVAVRGCALDLEAVAADGAVFDRASLNRCGADGR